jgi:hypothetical protein
MLPPPRYLGGKIKFKNEGKIYIKSCKYLKYSFYPEYKGYSIEIFLKA